jgi:DNA-binding transcriptional MerR regulator
MRIGELASKAEVSAQTVRLYERQRLLREPARTTSGYRSYGKSDLETLKFIKWSQQLGFTLTEVRQLLQLHVAVASLPTTHIDRKSDELRSIIRLAEEKLENIQDKIQSLRTRAGPCSCVSEQLSFSDEKRALRFVAVPAIIHSLRASRAAADSPAPSPRSNPNAGAVR